MNAWSRSNQDFLLCWNTIRFNVFTCLINANHIIKNNFAETVYFLLKAYIYTTILKFLPFYFFNGSNKKIESWDNKINAWILYLHRYFGKNWNVKTSLVRHPFDYPDEYFTKIIIFNYHKRDERLIITSIHRYLTS